MNKEENKALINFLLIYVLSSMILVGIIAILYYKKESFSIKDQCSVQLYSKSIFIEKELIKAQMDNKKFNVDVTNKDFNVGLYDESGAILFSNLKSKNIFLSKKSYTNESHEYHINKLENKIKNVSYIVIEGNQISKQMDALKLRIFVILVLASIFIGIVGYLLSKLLIKPLKSRMDKLNCFIKDSAHDLNTPLSALMMSVSTLRKEHNVDSRIINHISISSKLILQIYNSLSFIAFNNKDIKMEEEFNLKELILECAKLFNELAKSKNNKIETNLETTIVYMDRSNIQKVINNLISNAVKYSYSNTIINITLVNNILSIEDKGIGIAKKDQEIIFDRYQRKTTSVGGFGIGLSIVKSVCTDYDIKINIESKEKVGTTFSLSFAK